MQNQHLGPWMAQVKLLLGSVWRSPLRNGSGEQLLSQARGRPSVSQAHILDPLTTFTVGLGTNSSRPFWHPKLTFIFMEEGGKAPDEAHRGLGNHSFDFF